MISTTDQWLKDAEAALAKQVIDRVESAKRKYSTISTPSSQLTPTGAAGHGVSSGAVAGSDLHQAGR
ncbi:hypothetical protein [Corynebacterium mayonis]|uniref:hypothetical protein n=1 Tax=Corynebacterium mayonis TaxID=3062461 RepID=UPI003CC7F6AF